MPRSISAELVQKLCCPIDHKPVGVLKNSLVCASGHWYPIIDGIPVMLLEGRQTIGLAARSLAFSRTPDESDPYFIETLGLSIDERQQLKLAVASKDARGIDFVAQFLVGATSGISYKHLIGNLPRYPIPDLRLPDGGGRVLLDIGCSWGRWSTAAARKGYKVIGLDPSLGAVLAARRIAESFGLSIDFVVGDARHLPITDSALDVVFSYSVIQHFSIADAELTIHEIRRVLHQGGMSLVQMPTVLGLRCIYHQARRRWADPQGFEVRYWTIPSLRRAFANIGSVNLYVDCFFGIGLQASDMDLMPARYRFVIKSSEALRKLSGRLPALRWVADSLYVECRK